MKVLYYYYYSFYKMSCLDAEPSFTTKLALSFSELLLIMMIETPFFAYFFCYNFNKFILLGELVILLALNFFIFFPTKKEKEVLENHPMFFNSHKLSIVLCWIFFLVTTSSMFWLGDVVTNILEHCGSSSIIP